MSAPRRIRSNTPRPEDTPAGGAIVAPEAIDPRGGEAWAVRLSASPQGGTNLVDRRMFAPGGNDPASAHVRLHELMHARITPPDLILQGVAAGRTPDAMQASEDARIGEIGTRTPGLGLLGRSAAKQEEVRATMLAILQAAEAAAGMPETMGRDAMQARAYHGAACLAVCLWGTDRWAEAYHGLHHSAPGRVCSAAAAAVGEIRDHPHDPAATIRAAAHLDALLTPPPGRAPGGAAGGEDPEGDRPEIHPGEEAEAWDAAAEAVKVHEAPLTMRLSNPSRARRRTADLGRLSRPSEILRMEAGRPFTRRRKTEGAVILLDSSGSMRYGHEDLADIVRSAPGALVAIHAAQGELGTFAIVGKGGRCISAEDLSELRSRVGRGNANDGGCLQLLARMADRDRIPGPRYWVTDEGFGDAHGNVGARNVQAACRRLAARHGFEVVGHESQVFA